MLLLPGALVATVSCSSGERRRRCSRAWQAHGSTDSCHEPAHIHALYVHVSMTGSGLVRGETHGWAQVGSQVAHVPGQQDTCTCASAGSAPEPTGHIKTPENSPSADAYLPATHSRRTEWPGYSVTLLTLPCRRARQRRRLSRGVSTHAAERPSLSAFPMTSRSSAGGV